MEIIGWVSAVLGTLCIATGVGGLIWFALKYEYYDDGDDL